MENTFPELKENKYPMIHTELQNILIREKRYTSFIHSDSTIREEYTFTNNTPENKNISINIEEGFAVWDAEDFIFKLV